MHFVQMNKPKQKSMQLQRSYIKLTVLKQMGTTNLSWNQTRGSIIFQMNRLIYFHQKTYNVGIVIKTIVDLENKIHELKSV